MASVQTLLAARSAAASRKRRDGEGSLSLELPDENSRSGGTRVKKVFHVTEVFAVAE